MVAAGYASACQVTSTDPQAATQDDGDQDALNAATGGDGPFTPITGDATTTPSSAPRPPDDYRHRRLRALRSVRHRLEPSSTMLSQRSELVG